MKLKSWDVVISLNDKSKCGVELFSANHPAPVNNHSHNLNTEPAFTHLPLNKTNNRTDFQVLRLKVLNHLISCIVI